jgi:hypothetical protein
MHSGCESVHPEQSRVDTGESKAFRSLFLSMMVTEGGMRTTMIRESGVVDSPILF